MKLIKIEGEHYIIVDDSSPKAGDYALSKLNEIVVFGKNFTPTLYRKITHSTQPLNFDFIEPLVLSEVKELIGQVDVEGKAERANGYAYYGKPNGEKYLAFKEGFIEGYKQAIEDNKWKKYTENQAKQIWKAGQEYWKTSGASITFEELTERMINQPKTEWEVEFVDGKLKLK